MEKTREIFKKIAAFLAAKKKKIGILGAGYLGNAIIVYAFNWVLYPFVIWKFGLIVGGLVIMTILSFIICYLTILFYDWAKKDWLGIETLKEVKEYQGTKKAGKIAAWILRKGEIPTLLFMSVKFDPFITTVYMRHGSNQYNGMSQRDWKIFVASWLIGNVYWSVAMYSGVTAVEYIWQGVF